jgi:hypothetical protein
MLGIWTAVRGVKKAFEELGNLSDESKRLGIPAEKLSALQYAANQAGIETETLSKSLQYMMKKGFSVDKLERFADELQKMPDDVKRMQFVLSRFGKGGAGMLNLFEGGSKGLRKAMDEAKALGYAMTQAQVDAAEKAGDSWARIGKVIDGVYRTAAVSLGFYLDLLADKIVGVSVKAGGLSSVMDKLFERAAEHFEAYIGWMDRLALRIELAVKFWKAVATLGLNERMLKDLDDVIKNLEIIRANPIEDRMRYERLKRKKRWDGEFAGRRFGEGAGHGISAGGGASDMAALIRGSQAAFSAILNSNKNQIPEKSLTELEKHTKLLTALSRTMDPLLGASLE